MTSYVPNLLNEYDYIIPHIVNKDQLSVGKLLTLVHPKEGF